MEFEEITISHEDAKSHDPDTHSAVDENEFDTDSSLYDPEGSLQRVEAQLEQESLERSKLDPHCPEEICPPKTDYPNIETVQYINMSELSFQSGGSIPVITDVAQIKVNTQPTPTGELCQSHDPKDITTPINFIIDSRYAQPQKLFWVPIIPFYTWKNNYATAMTFCTST